MAATNATTPPLDPKRAQESIGYQLTTAVAVCTSLAAFFTVLRLYTRLVLLRKFFWEDLSIASALVRRPEPRSGLPRHRGARTKRMLTGDVRDVRTALHGAHGRVQPSGYVVLHPTLPLIGSSAGFLPVTA